MLLLWIACVKEQPNKPVDDSEVLYRHSEEVVDTDPTDSGDSVPVDTDTGGDTADTADTGEVQVQPVLLEAFPRQLTVGVGASWTAHLIVTDSDGLRVETPADGWTVDDPAVASVDATGLVTALAAGSTQLHAVVGALTADAALTVRDDGLITVTVIDANTGLPIEGVKSRISGGAIAETNASGMAVRKTPSAGPVDVEVWKYGWDGAVVVGTISRSVVLYLPEIRKSGPEVPVHGTVDFSNVTDADWDGVVLGMAGTSVQGELGSLIVDDLFSADRSISVIGFDVKAPGNLFVEGSAEDYEGVAYPGDVAGWAMAGPMKIADLPLGAGAGEALSVITSHLDTFSWGYREGGVASEGSTTELDLAPTAAFDDQVTVTLPALSTGFNGNENYFIMATDEHPTDGWVFVGFGSGLPGDTVDVARVAEGAVAGSVGSALLLYNQVGGLGTGGPICSVVVDLTTPKVPVPAMQQVAVTSLDLTSHQATVTVDPRASYVRIKASDNEGRVWDIYTSGSWTGTIPTEDASWVWTKTDLEVIALESSWSSFEDRVMTGDWEPRNQRASTMARTVINN